MSLMQKYIALLLLLWILPLSAQQKWDLQTCLDYAHTHNLQLQQTKLEIEQAKINKSGAKAAYLPNINTNASASWNSGLTQNFTTGVLENQTTFGGNGQLSSNINIFNGLSNHYNYKKSLLEIISAEHQYQDMLNRIDLQLATAYMQILLNKENWDMAKVQLENSIRQKEKVQELIQAGLSPKGDLADAEAQITNDHLKTVQAQNAYELSKLKLAQLLELNDFENFEINEDLSGLKIDEKIRFETTQNLYTEALRNNANLKKNLAQEKIADYQIKIARSRYLPSLSGFANINTRYSDRDQIGFGGMVTPADPFWNQVKDNQGITYGLNLRIPILNGFSVKNNVKSAKLGKKRVVIATENIKKDLKNNIYQLHQDLKAAYENMKAAEANLKAQQKSYDYALEKYNVGIMNIFDLNTIKTKFSIAQNQYINAKYQYYLKSKILEYSLK